MDLDSRINGENQKEEQEQEEEKGEEQHFHVLAVDDSLIDRKLLERLLTVSSYQVTCVDSGNKALEYLGLLDNNKDKNDSSNFTTSSSCTSSSNQSAQQQVQGSKVNLIITDYSMPGMNGYDLLKKVKGSSRKDIPVVVMSSENVPSRINMCLEGGAEEFLLKPVQLSDLSKLQSHLSKPTAHSRQNLNDNLIENHDDDEDDNKNNNKSSGDEFYQIPTDTGEEKKGTRPHFKELNTTLMQSRSQDTASNQLFPKSPPNSSKQTFPYHLFHPDIIF
ncbi:hypothetical protein Vadar_019679 [Vaccinium darrowii]|uniref:Uncharacterized protein n=1 Tax=Vaccinium darrowii TaxID=229202 RepID=A0ACB7X2I0_9ERIC|nr:hypothetical protein Vadar_019679 [Vaccinium darrowii]